MPRRQTSDDIDEALNPHRSEEQERAAQHAVDLLRKRDMTLYGDESPEELDALQTAAERFEAVEARGAAPLPRREDAEPVIRYVMRIEQAAQALTTRR